MFSAIVAAVLFLAGVMLVQTMVSTEERVSGQIFSMEENFALSDAANLARSDSIQTFNYHFRERLEFYLTNPDNEFAILYRNVNGESNYDNPENDWDNVVKEFEKQILLIREDAGGGENFDSVLRFVSKKMIDEFRPGAYGRYDVSLDVVNSNEAITILSETLKKSITTARDNGESFLEVVDCDMGAKKDCPLGTFYFNIPLNNITAEDYEQLPRIIVKDLITGEEIKISILPRSNLRLYIPLRFFKAVHNSSLQYSPSVKQSHSTFEDYRLGYCDSGCNTRTSPTSSSTGNRTRNCSPSSSSSDAIETLSGSPAGVTQYNAGGLGSTGSIGLRASAIQSLCNSGASAAPSSDSRFFNVDLEDPDFSGMEPNNSDVVVKIENCPFEKIVIGTATYASKALKISEGSTTTEKLYCGYINSVSATLVFRETNTQYTVKGEQNEYRIKIVDEDFPRQPDVASPEMCCSGEGTCRSC